MQLLLMVGAKLENIISSLALDVSEKRNREEEAVITPSDELFWFHRPGIVLQLIHFILFQNSFEIAFFFWILVQFPLNFTFLFYHNFLFLDLDCLFMISASHHQFTYGIRSCIMEKLGFLIPRLVMG